MPSILLGMTGLRQSSLCLLLGSGHAVQWSRVAGQEFRVVADLRLLEVLQQNEMLAGLSDVVLRQLLADGSMRSFGSNEALIHQGDPARWFAVVIEGRAKLVQLALDGRQALIRYIGPAQEFGIIAVLPDTDYPLSVQAVEPCMAIFWTG